MATGLAGAIPMLLLALAAMLFLVWFLLPYGASRPCPTCGARARMDATQCAVCLDALPGPPEGHPGAVPYGFPRPSAAPPRPAPRVEGGVAYDRGLTRGVVTLATAAMGLGIGLRMLGMLGVLGLPQVPTVWDGLLTIAGGILAFVGFVVLDAA